VNTDTEQDEQRDRLVVDINASVGEHSNKTTYQGHIPDHTKDQKIADFDAEQDADTVKTEDGKCIKDGTDQEDAVALVNSPIKVLHR